MQLQSLMWSWKQWQHVLLQSHSDARLSSQADSPSLVLFSPSITHVLPEVFDETCYRGLTKTAHLVLERTRMIFLTLPYEPFLGFFVNYTQMAYYEAVLKVE